jgi:hypothetical protein
MHGALVIDPLEIGLPPMRLDLEMDVLATASLWLRAPDRSWHLSSDQRSSWAELPG